MCVPDKFAFIYDREVPLAFNERECARLVLQIRGGPDEMPQVKDLIFKDDYGFASRSSVRVKTITLSFI